LRGRDDLRVVFRSRAAARPYRVAHHHYKQLHREVCLFANVLKRNGIQKGDRILIYLPMVPEAAVAMLACTRIGAVHSIVFGGFSAQSVADRVFDSQAKMIITADGGFRRGCNCGAEEKCGRCAAIKDAQEILSPRPSRKSSCCAARK